MIIKFDAMTATVEYKRTVTMGPVHHQLLSFRLCEAPLLYAHYMVCLKLMFSYICLIENTFVVNSRLFTS